MQSLNAKIFICVDETGRKHYSDKHCPRQNQNVTGTMNKSGTINKLGKLEIPEEIRVYTSAIQVIKQGFTLLISREPQNREYADVYQLVTVAERRHQMFISNPDEKLFETYLPLSAGERERMISSLSDACRQHGYFSICSAIEGNPWLSKEEQNLLNSMPEQQRFRERDTFSCDKATSAHSGGVISDKMLMYFCRR